jgi:hypothetical protein
MSTSITRTLLLRIASIVASRFVRAHGMIAAPDVLYHNNGDGTFGDVTREAGMGVLPHMDWGSLGRLR